jgi:hypothetical protein
MPSRKTGALNGTNRVQAQPSFGPNSVPPSDLQSFPQVSADEWVRGENMRKFRRSDPLKCDEAGIDDLR